MGYIQHHAIVVTGWGRARVQRGYDAALRICAEVGVEPFLSPIFEGLANGRCSFLIGPDGSKEGWELSNKANDVRAAWKAWEKADRQSPEPAYLDWVEVTFAGDEPDVNCIVEANS